MSRTYDRTRPTLEDLKAAPLELLRLEVAQLCVDAGIRERYDVLSQAEEMMLQQSLEPEKIVELRNQLRDLPGSTQIEGNL